MHFAFTSPGDELIISSPSTGETIETLTSHSAEAIADICLKARRAQADWAAIPRYERCRILLQAADLIAEKKEKMANLLCRESGKILPQSHFEVDFSIELLRANANHVRFMQEKMIPTDALAGTVNDLAWEKRVPLGTVAAILPFNFPLELLIEKAGAALAMGNAVVVKLPEDDPLALLMMIDCFYEAGVPEAILPAIIGGRESGECLVNQPGLAAISLTGSTAAGIAVAEACAPHLRQLHLELGGNDASIILDDADLELVVPNLIFGRTLMNGQACASNKRVIVHRALLPELEQRLLSSFAEIRVGDSLDPQSGLGPLISEVASTRVLSQIKQAMADGANVLFGDVARNKAFLNPHLLTNVPPSAAIAVDEEIFGPVLPLIPVDSESEAIAVANQSSFGLSGSVFTRDWQRGLRVAEAMQSGGCVVNGTGNYRPFTVPFGGVKLSGLGREGLGYTAEEMSRLKYIVLRNFKSMS